MKTGKILDDMAQLSEAEVPAIASPSPPGSS
jgi:hypothetical protein